MLEGEGSCFDFSCSTCSCLHHYCLDKAHLPTEQVGMVCFIPGHCRKCQTAVPGQVGGWEDGSVRIELRSRGFSGRMLRGSAIFVLALLLEDAAVPAVF